MACLPVVITLSNEFIVSKLVPKLVFGQFLVPHFYLPMHKLR